MDYYLYLWLVVTDDLLGATVLQCQALSKVNTQFISECFFNHSSPETIIVVAIIVIL